MSEQPRNWDKELAEIDRLMGKAAPAASPARKAPGPPPPPARRAVTTRREALGVWVRTLLGAGLAVAALRWPYGTVCGIPLAGYLGTLGLALGVGVWAAVHSWRRRMGRAHAAAFAVILVGTSLVLLAILPRFEPGGDATWWCR